MANSHSLALVDASSQYAKILDANQTGLDFSGDYTIEYWVKFDSLPPETAGQNNMYMIMKGDWSTHVQYAFGVRNISGVIRLQAYTYDSSDTQANSYWTPTINTGTWYHLALTFDISNAVATQFELYIDGVSQGNGTAAGSDISSIYNSTEPLTIGTSLNGGAVYQHCVDGHMDEVRLWSDLRTEQEIQDNYETELVGNEANLVGYWKFNNSALDETSNNNDLTLINSPSYSTDIPFSDSLVLASSIFMSPRTKFF